MDEQIINEALTNLGYYYKARLVDEKRMDENWTETQKKIDRIEEELSRM